MKQVLIFNKQGHQFGLPAGGKGYGHLQHIEFPHGGVQYNQDAIDGFFGSFFIHLRIHFPCRSPA